MKNRSTLAEIAKEYRRDPGVASTEPAPVPPPPDPDEYDPHAPIPDPAEDDSRGLAVDAQEQAELDAAKTAPEGPGGPGTAPAPKKGKTVTTIHKV